MLVKALLDLIYNLLDLVLFAELPAMPDTVLTLLDEVTSYVVMGVDVLRSFIGSSALMVIALIFNLVLSFHLFYMVWSMVFWILRKIPMLNIKE